MCRRVFGSCAIFILIFVFVPCFFWCFLLFLGDFGVEDLIFQLNSCEFGYFPYFRVHFGDNMASVSGSKYCSVCRVSVLLGNWARHCNGVHGAVESRSIYVCGICSYESPRIDNVKRHCMSCPSSVICRTGKVVLQKTRDVWRPVRGGDVSVLANEVNSIVVGGVPSDVSSVPSSVSSAVLPVPVVVSSKVCYMCQTGFDDVNAHDAHLAVCLASYVRGRDDVRSSIVTSLILGEMADVVVPLSPVAGDG